MDAVADVVRWPLGGWPRVLAAGRFTQDSRGFAEDFRHPGLAIHLFAYAARVLVAGRELLVEPGDLLLTPPEVEERFDIPRAGVHWCIRAEAAGGAPWIELPLLHRLGREAATARARIALVAEDHRLAGGEPRHPAARGAAAGVQALLAWLAARLQAPAAAADRAEQAVRRAEVLLSHEECAGVPIAEIARRAGLSQNRLARAFLLRHGCTMVRFRTARLIARAQWLMESTDLPLAEIRRRIEIRDAQRFNKLFRRAAGCSPQAWREARPALVTSSPRPAVAGR